MQIQNGHSQFPLSLPDMGIRWGYSELPHGIWAMAQTNDRSFSFFPPAVTGFHICPFHTISFFQPIGYPWESVATKSFQLPSSPWLSSINKC